MYDDGSGYDLGDPKHPSYHERMSDAADHRRKADRENARPPEADIKITRDGELMVAQAEGVTEAGEEFIDAYLPESGQLVVVDAGRIVLRQTEISRFATAAREYGLDLSEADVHDA